MKTPLKTSLRFVVFALLLAMLASPCFAMMSLRELTKEEAKEMGVQLRFQGNGPNEVWVELELKPEGKLKHFDHVSLEINEGEKLLLGYAPLQGRRLGSGSIVVTFLANRAYVDKISLTMVIGDLGDEGLVVQAKKFLEPAGAAEKVK